MKAFLRLEDGFFVKVTEQANDWQVVSKGGKERWYSKWTYYEGGEMDSLVRAINSFMKNETDYDERFDDFEILQN